MKRFGIWIILGLVSSFLYADSYDFSVMIDTIDTGAISVSTSAATPTQILSSNPAATRTWIINTSTATVYLSGPNPTASSPLTTVQPFSISLTTGSFYLVGGSTQTWSPDGINGPYRGPMWAVVSAGTSLSIIRERSK